MGAAGLKSRRLPQIEAENRVFGVRYDRLFMHHNPCSRGYRTSLPAFYMVLRVVPRLGQVAARRITPRSECDQRGRVAISIKWATG